MPKVMDSRAPNTASTRSTNAGVTVMPPVKSTRSAERSVSGRAGDATSRSSSVGAADSRVARRSAMRASTGRRERQDDVLGPRPERADDAQHVARGVEQRHRVQPDPPRRRPEPVGEGAAGGDHPRVGDLHALGPARGAGRELDLRQALRVHHGQVGRRGELDHGPPVGRAPADVLQRRQPLGGLRRQVGHRVAADVLGGVEAGRAGQPERVLQLRRAGSRVDRDEGHPGQGHTQLEQHRLGAVAQAGGDPRAGRPPAQQAGRDRPGRRPAAGPPSRSPRSPARTAAGRPAPPGRRGGGRRRGRPPPPGGRSGQQLAALQGHDQPKV